MKQTDNTKWRRLWDRYKYAVLVIVLGTALLLIPFGKSGKTQTQTTSTAVAEQSVEDTEKKMETILSKIDGVGELHLMLTPQTGTEQRLAQNTDLSYSGDQSAPDDFDRSSETVLASQSGDETPVVTQTFYPTWRGALIVCQGGGNAQVKLAVTQAVAALTGLSSDRITVVKCQ